MQERLREGTNEWTEQNKLPTGKLTCADLIFKGDLGAHFCRQNKYGIIPEKIKLYKEKPPTLFPPRNASKGFMKSHFCEIHQTAVILWDQLQPLVAVDLCFS